MNARLVWWLAATLVAAGLGCASPRTEILLVVGADLSVPDDIDHVMIRASGADSDGGFAHTYDVTQSQTPLPLTLGLLSAGGRSGPLHVDVTGLKGVTEVVARSASTSFVEGKVLVLHIDLLKACVSVMCADDKQTCIAGACSSDTISSLPSYTGPITSDGGADGRRADAGPDVEAAEAGAADMRDETPIDAVDNDLAGKEAAADAPGLPNGTSCSPDTRCASGHCVDGFCCDSPCSDACNTCGSPSAPGTCSLIEAGAVDPRGQCIDRGAAACGTTGRCDGAGACAVYPAATICAAERCDGDTYVPEAKCGAVGQCQAPSSTTCAAGSCRAGGCAPVPMITVGSTQDTVLQGYDGPEATNFEDACPNGSLVIGYEESTDSDEVAQLQTMCGTPSVSADGSTMLVTPGATLILRGGITAPLVSSLCPANQVVVGFDGRAFALLDQLSVRCAPVTISGQTLSIGSITNLAPLGGNGGQPFARTDCGPGMVAVGTNVALRNWVSGFGLVCASLGVK